MDKPNLLIIGHIHHIDDYDPDEDMDRVETIERAVLIQFPDHQSIKEFLKTGKIEECIIFGEKA